MKLYTREIFALASQTLNFKLRNVVYPPKINAMLQKYSGVQKILHAIHIIGKVDISTFFTGSGFSLESLPPLTKTSYYIHYHTPKQYFPATYFLSVFDLKLWWAVVGICFSVTVLLGLWHFFNKKPVSALIEALFDIFTISTKQIATKSISSNITKNITMIWIFLIASVFSSFLVAQLTVIKEKVPFNSLEELVHHDTYVICANKLHNVFSIRKDLRLIKDSSKCKIRYDRKTIQDNNIFCLSEDTTYILSDREFNFLYGKEKQ